jgi:hypothetical protein
MTAKKKKPSKVIVHLDKKKPRAKRLPRTAFKKGNTQGFHPGQSGSPGGKPKSGEKRLLSKAMNIFLSDRAPDEAGKAVGLPPNPPSSTSYIYSWAQILAKRILNLAVRGEAWAVSEISRLTEPVHSRLTLGGFDSEGTEETAPVMRLAFIRSDGNGGVCAEDLASFPELAVKTIEGEAAKPSSLKLRDQQ